MISLRRFRAVARKEFIHVWRDPRALGVSIALPFILLLLFGYALTLDVDRIPLAVWDQSRTPASRELVSRFEHSRYFSVLSRPEGYADIERDLDHNRILMALVVPVDYGQKVASDRPAQVQVLVDGSDANTATIALNDAENIVRGLSQELLVSRIARQGTHPPAAALDLRPRAWFNPDMESRIYIVPGLIAVIVMLIASLLTSLTIAREWETGTMEQLISTPVHGTELILGKLAPYLAIAVLDTLLSLIAGYVLFEVPMRGNLLLLGGVSLVYIAGALSLGILISALAKTQLLASQLAFVGTFLPAFLLSGFMFDIANMPKALQIVTGVVPARYYVTFLRGLMLKGVGLGMLWRECLLLALFCALMIALSVRAFRKRLG
jgi:ABC-2 type transport system permease protein